MIYDWSRRDHSLSTVIYLFAKQNYFSMDTFIHSKQCFHLPASTKATITELCHRAAHTKVNSLCGNYHLKRDQHKRQVGSYFVTLRYAAEL